jgi:hypothetical protein
MRMECLQTLFAHQNIFRTLHYDYILVNSPYSIIEIPYVGRPYELNVIDYFKAISFVAHVNFKLKN